MHRYVRRRAFEPEVKETVAKLSKSQEEMILSMTAARFSISREKKEALRSLPIRYRRSESSTRNLIIRINRWMPNI